jgi:hypothetical protein
MTILIRGEIFRRNTCEQDFVNCLESVRKYILPNFHKFVLVYDVVTSFVERVLSFIDTYKDIVHVLRVKHVAKKNQVRTVIDSLEFTQKIVNFSCPIFVIRCDLLLKTPLIMKPTKADILVPWLEKSKIGGTSADMFFIIFNSEVIKILYENIEKNSLHFLGRSKLHLDTFLDGMYFSDTSKKSNPIYDIVDRITGEEHEPD